MKRIALLVLTSVLAPAAAAAPATDPPRTLRYRLPSGARRVYRRTLRTDAVVERGEKKVRRVTEVPVRRETLVVETKTDPARMRVVTLETPTGERLVGYEEDGEDRLAGVPEERRLRPLPPVLAAHWRDPTGRPVEEQPVPANPMQVIDRALAELRHLPAGPVGPDTPATTRVDLGLAHLTITTRQVERRTVGDTDAVVLEAKGELTFTGDWADRISVPTLTARTAWALDGSGMLSERGSIVVDEKTEEASQHLVRNWEERLAESGRVPPEALTRAKANLDTLERAMADARNGKLDAALDTLKTYLAENPDGTWTPAVQALRSALEQRRLLGEPVPAPRLRLLLRDLQARRDQAGARGNEDQLARIDQTLRRLARTNAKQVLMDASDPDPIVRDLATFGLAFLDDPQAADRLRALAEDVSGQVRGTALVSLALRGESLPTAALLKRLRDDTPRVRGAAALLAARTMKRGDAGAADLVDPLVANLSAESPWTRRNTISALARLAPKGSAKAVRALVRAHEKESETSLKQLALAALAELTGVDAQTVEPYRRWLQEKGGAEG